MYYLYYCNRFSNCMLEHGRPHLRPLSRGHFSLWPKMALNGRTLFFRNTNELKLVYFLNFVKIIYFRFIPCEITKNEIWFFIFYSKNIAGGTWGRNMQFFLGHVNLPEWLNPLEINVFVEKHFVSNWLRHVYWTIFVWMPLGAKTPKIRRQR